MKWVQLCSSLSILWHCLSLGLSFPGGSEVKAFCLEGRRPGFDPWVWKNPWRRKRQPTPVLLPGEFQGQKQAPVHGVTKSQTWQRRKKKNPDEPDICLLWTGTHAAEHFWRKPTATERLSLSLIPWQISPHSCNFSHASSYILQQTLLALYKLRLLLGMFFP